MPRSMTGRRPILSERAPHAIGADELPDGHRRSRDADPRAEILRVARDAYPSTMNGSIGHTTFRLKVDDVQQRQAGRRTTCAPLSPRGARGRRHLASTRFRRARATGRLERRRPTPPGRDARRGAVKRRERSGVSTSHGARGRPRDDAPPLRKQFHGGQTPGQPLSSHAVRLRAYSSYESRDSFAPSSATLSLARRHVHESLRVDGRAPKVRFARASNLMHNVDGAAACLLDALSHPKIESLLVDVAERLMPDDPPPPPPRPRSGRGLRLSDEIVPAHDHVEILVGDVAALRDAVFIVDVASEERDEFIRAHAAAARLALLPSSASLPISCLKLPLVMTSFSSANLLLARLSILPSTL